MTFLEMQTEVFRRLDESSTSPAYWALAEVKTALNEGYQELSDASEWRSTSATISLTTNTQYYDVTTAGVLTDEILTAKAAFNTQTNRWMEPSDTNELDLATYPRWGTVTGEPEKFFMRGLWNFGVFPKKASTAGTFLLIYTAMPAALSADGDTPGFPQEFHYGIVEYALYDLYCQDKETRIKGRRHWKRYLLHENGLRDWVGGRVQMDRLGVLSG